MWQRMDAFPSMAKIQLQQGKSVAMAELQIGDSVQTGLKFQYKYIYKVT